jgi:uncharacterized integral membrane protein
MKRLGRLLLALVSLLGLVLGAAVVVLNRDPFPVDLLVWRGADLSLGLVLVCVFVAGAITGLAVAAFAGGVRRISGRGAP